MIVLLSGCALTLAFKQLVIEALLFDRFVWCKGKTHVKFPEAKANAFLKNWKLQSQIGFSSWNEQSKAFPHFNISFRFWWNIPFWHKKCPQFVGILALLIPGIYRTKEFWFADCFLADHRIWHVGKQVHRWEGRKKNPYGDGSRDFAALKSMPPETPIYEIQNELVVPISNAVSGQTFLRNFLGATVKCYPARDDRSSHWKHRKDGVLGSRFFSSRHHYHRVMICVCFHVVPMVDVVILVYCLWMCWYEIVFRSRHWQILFCYSGYTIIKKE